MSSPTNGLVQDNSQAAQALVSAATATLKDMFTEVAALGKPFDVLSELTFTLAAMMDPKDTSADPALVVTGTFASADKTLEVDVAYCRDLYFQLALDNPSSTSVESWFKDLGLSWPGGGSPAWAVDQIVFASSDEGGSSFGSMVWSLKVQLSCSPSLGDLGTLDAIEMQISGMGSSVDGVTLSATLALGTSSDPPKLYAYGSYLNGNWAFKASLSGDIPLQTLLTALGHKPSFDASVTELEVGFSSGGDYSLGGSIAVSIFGTTEKPTLEDPGKGPALATVTGTVDLSSSAGVKAQSFELDVTGTLSSQTLLAALTPLAGTSVDLSKVPLEVDLLTLGVSHDGTDWTLGGSGLLHLEGIGAAVKLALRWHKDGQSTTCSLRIGELELDSRDSVGPRVELFALSSSQAVSTSLSHLAKLLRLDALESSAIEISLAGALVAKSGTGSTAKKLLLLAVDFKDFELDDSVIRFVTGGVGMKLGKVTLLLASDAWSADDLAPLRQPNVPALPASVLRGPTLLADLTIGSDQVTATLSPSGLASASHGGSPNETGEHTAAAPPPPSGSPHWLDVERTIGPVYVGRIALSLDPAGDGEVLVDGAVTLGGLTVSLDDLRIAVPLSWPFDPSRIQVSLHGLNVGYQRGALSIDGGLLHQDASGVDAYAGQLSIQTSTLSFSALGEYANVTPKLPPNSPSYTSFFVFAALNEPPLGGPPAFFVTGLSAGFGYNNQLLLPTKPSEVEDFSLVQVAQGKDPKAPATTWLGEIQSQAVPAHGSDWCAIGVHFTSFQQLDSLALLAVGFGNELQFDLIGQSTFSIPPSTDGVVLPEYLAYAKVDLLATYKPSTHLLSVCGQLASESYVYSPLCRVTGGFAFCLWDGGDFVATFGGYAPTYDFASHHYPAVPRIQLAWQINDHTAIKGDTYFAVTPALMMAGGGLAATWSSGIFSAWFNVSLDLLLRWKPFHYSGDFQMSLGVRFSLHILFCHVHFSFQVGASLHAEGPPFAGSAHIDLDVVSFTIAFGASPTKPPPLKWSEFRQLLPGESANDATDSPLISVKVVGGIVRTLPTDAKDETAPRAVVDGCHFSFQVDTAIPVTGLDGAIGPSSTVPLSLGSACVAFGVQPMSATGLSSAVTVGLTDKANKYQPLSLEPASRAATTTTPVCCTPVQKSAPLALWSPSPADHPTTSDTAIPDAVMGLVIRGGRPAPTGAMQPVPVSALATPPEPATCTFYSQASIGQLSSKPPDAKVVPDPVDGLRAIGVLTR